MILETILFLLFFSFFFLFLFVEFADPLEASYSSRISVMEELDLIDSTPKSIKGNVCEIPAILVVVSNSMDGYAKKETACYFTSPKLKSRE